MKISKIKRDDFYQSSFFVNWDPNMSIMQMCEIYKDEDMFDTLFDRILCYLISNVDYDGSTLGRSSDILMDLFEESERTAEKTKEVKSILHQMYKRRLICRNGSEVQLMGNYEFYIIHGFSNNIAQLVIRTYYDEEADLNYNGNHVYYAQNIYHVVHQDKILPEEQYNDDLQFITGSVPPICDILRNANRLFYLDPSQSVDMMYPNKEALRICQEMNWVDISKGYIRPYGCFFIREIPDDNQYYLIASELPF